MFSTTRPAFGARDHQERVEDADQIVALLDRAFERLAILLRILGDAQGLLGPVAQARQRRLEVVGDVVGHLLQARHELADPVEHGVERGGETVELVIRAGERQALGELARHDGVGARRHRIDAGEDAPRHDEAADEAAKP